MNAFLQIWIRGYSTSSSTHFCDFSNPLFLSFSEPGIGIAKKIDGFQSLIGKERAPSFQISSYFSFQLFPFQATKMSSVSNTIVSAAAAAPVDAPKEKKPRKPKTVAAPAAAAADDAEVAAVVPSDTESKPKKAAKAKAEGDAPKEKKPRKPKTVAVAAAAETDDDDAPLPAVAAVAALPGSTVAIAAGHGPAAPVQRANAHVSDDEAPASDDELRACAAAPAPAPAAAPKEKKPRKPRAKKAAPAADAALEDLDDAGKIAYLMAEVSVLKKQLAAVLEGRAADASAAGDKKPRKKREPKEKVVCPVAADGVVRFHSTLKNKYVPLNNSFKADITIDDVVYPTVEHYYQCAKFLDTAPEYAEKIRATANPALIKNMGRTKKVEARADWEDVHLEVMRKALVAKFEQHDELSTLLAETGDAPLEMETPSDAFWGIGADGSGTNQLGKMLAEIRTSL